MASTGRASTAPVPQNWPESGTVRQFSLPDAVENRDNLYNGAYIPPVVGDGDSGANVLIPMHDVIETQTERYHVVEAAAETLYGAVYKAERESDGEIVAIKATNKQRVSEVKENGFRENPYAESEFLGDLVGLPHFSTMLSQFETAQYIFTVMPYAKFGDLCDEIQRGRPSRDDSIRYVRDVANTIDCLHERGLAFLDLSIENVLLFDGKKAKLTDPGQCLRLRYTEAGSEAEQVLDRCFCKSYRPPEAGAGKPFMPTRVDSWCLGFLTYSLLTGDELFVSVVDEKFAHFKQNGLPRGDLDDAAFDFISKLMAIDPMERMTVREATDHEFLTGTSEDLCTHPEPLPLWQVALAPLVKRVLDLEKKITWVIGEIGRIWKRIEKIEEKAKCGESDKENSAPVITRRIVRRVGFEVPVLNTIWEAERARAVSDLRCRIAPVLAPRVRLGAAGNE